MCLASTSPTILRAVTTATERSVAAITATKDSLLNWVLFIYKILIEAQYKILPLLGLQKGNFPFSKGKTQAVYASLISPKMTFTQIGSWLDSKGI